LKKVFLSDFDGTITKKDVIDSIMEKFAPPEWKEIHNNLINGIIDIDVGIEKMFKLLPSSKKDDILNWVLENIEIREGFNEFLDFLNENNIPFVVLSGGIDFYIEPLLEPYKNKILKIYSNKAHFDKDFIEVGFIYKCDNICKRHCGVCKPYIMERDFKNYYRYFAGDGITDIYAVEFSNEIFATSSLKNYLKKNNIKFYKFENFYDIMEVLNKEAHYGV
jgi:2-hydroxy-3-keto-5-methylthiopentenyl-1-phosphate phosphatase